MHNISSSSLSDGPIYDVFGIGFGPANLALAIAMQEMRSDLSVRFFDRKSGPAWQDGMLLDGADIQNNPLRDLVTPRNPQSHYSFVNYLHQEKRLFRYLNTSMAHPLRKDFSRYVVWAAEHFADQVVYGTDIAAVRMVANPFGDRPHLWQIETVSGETLSARALVLGTGRLPRIPPVFKPVLGPSVFHLNDYLPRLTELHTALGAEGARVAVVGSSQSAGEIVLDLMARYPKAGVLNLIRGYGYRMKDLSPFSEEVYFPDFTEMFYDATPDQKLALYAELKATNYSAVDPDICNALYQRLYEQDIDGDAQLEILRFAKTTAVSLAEGGKVVLAVEDTHSRTMRTETVDAVILATGFENLGFETNEETTPPALREVAHLFRREDNGTLKIQRNYQLIAESEDVPPLFLNGLCEFSHGFGDAGSFSLLALRSAEILEGLGQSLVPSKVAAE